MRIRPGGIADLRVLMDHRLRMWFDIGGRSRRAITLHGSTYRRWVAPKLRTGEVVAVVAEAGGVVVGSGCLWFQPAQPRPGELEDTAPYILSMYTLPSYRGRGIASRIVRELVRLSRDRGFPRVTLHASPQGRPVYRRLGFERTWEMRRWLIPRARRPSRR